MKKLHLAAVKYLNTLPMLHGLQNSTENSLFELHLEHPAECARKLIEGEVEIALCPVGALVDLPSYHIVSKYGIACQGPVRTVSIYSHAPLQDLKQLNCMVSPGLPTYWLKSLIRSIGNLDSDL